MTTVLTSAEVMAEKTKALTITRLHKGTTNILITFGKFLVKDTINLVELQRTIAYTAKLRELLRKEAGMPEAKVITRAYTKLSSLAKRLESEQQALDAGAATSLATYEDYLALGRQSKTAVMVVMMVDNKPTAVILLHNLVNRHLAAKSKHLAASVEANAYVLVDQKEEQAYILSKAPNEQLLFDANGLVQVGQTQWLHNTH